MSSPITHSTCAVCHMSGRLQVFETVLSPGGLCTTATNTAEIYDPFTDTWTAIASLPEAFASFAMLKLPPQ